MYFPVEGLSCIEKQLQYARDKYKVEILQYPHWLLSKCVDDMVYCPSHKFDFKIKKLTLKDIYNKVRQDTGIEYIITGAKKADSLWRRRFHANPGSTFDNVIHPVWDWNKFDIVAYLKVNKIQLPYISKGKASGIDLSTPSLLWLYDNHPDDFEKVADVFPYIMAVVKRREFYGIN